MGGLHNKNNSPRVWAIVAFGIARKTRLCGIGYLEEIDGKLKVITLNQEQTRSIRLGKLLAKATKSKFFWLSEEYKENNNDN